MPAAGTFSVGVTGHRPNRLRIGEQAVMRRLRWVLAGLADGAGTRSRIAVSALAEGADRMFAMAALDLGYRLEANLPFPSTDYETTFSDRATTPVYRSLLARAAKTSELPGTLADTKSAYTEVGKATVSASNVLVAVWDGAGAAGRGGTPEILGYAVEQGIPVIWIDAAHLRLPRLIQATGTAPKGHVSLGALATSAQPLGAGRLRRLPTF